MNKTFAEFLGYPTKHYWWHHPDPHFRAGVIPSSLTEETCHFKDDWNWFMSLWKIVDKEISGHELRSEQNELKAKTMMAICDVNLERACMHLESLILSDRVISDVV
jgi:hypothetical protein